MEVTYQLIEPLKQLFFFQAKHLVKKKPLWRILKHPEVERSKTMRSVSFSLKVSMNMQLLKTVFKTKTNRNLKKRNLWILHDTSDWCFLIFALYFSRKPFKKGIATKVDRSTISSRAQPANHWPLSDLFINNIVFKTGNIMAPESFPGWKSKKWRFGWFRFSFPVQKGGWFSGDFRSGWLQGGIPTLPVPSLARIIFINLFPKETSAKDESKGQFDSSWYIYIYIYQLSYQLYHTYINRIYMLLQTDVF